MVYLDILNQIKVISFPPLFPSLWICACRRSFQEFGKFFCWRSVLGFWANYIHYIWMIEKKVYILSRIVYGSKSQMQSVHYMRDNKGLSLYSSTNSVRIACFRTAPFFCFFSSNFVANSVRIENDTRIYWTDLIKKVKNHISSSKMEIAIRALYMEEYGAKALIIHM